MARYVAHAILDEDQRIQQLTNLSGQSHRSNQLSN
jgi:hypothetical protein